MALIRLDLPTLLLPRKAISGNPSAGNRSRLLALRTNSAINITTPETEGLQVRLGRLAAVLFYRTLRLCEIVEHLPQGIAPMTDGELAFRVSLSKRAVERGIEEERVVAKAARPSRFVDDPAFHRSTKGFHDASFVRDGDRADKSSCPIGHTGQSFEQQAVVRFVGRVFSCVARGVHAGFAIQRIDLKTGIVGEEQAGRESAVIRSLQARVVIERQSGFFRRHDGLDIGDRFDSDAEHLARQAKLAEFAGITRGAPDRHAASMILFWAASSSAIPARASARIASICSSSKLLCSAVA